MIGGTHFVIDLIKSHLPKCKGSLLCFNVDQLLHFIVILSVWAYLFGYFAFINVDTLRHAITLEFVAITLSYLLILKPTSIVIQFVLKPWRLSNNTDSYSQGSEESLDKRQMLTTTKRYRDFELLHNELCLWLHSSEVPALPRKGFWRSLDNAFLERRRAHLEAWLQSLLRAGGRVFGMGGPGAVIEDFLGLNGVRLKMQRKGKART